MKAARSLGWVAVGAAAWAAAWTAPASAQPPVKQLEGAVALRVRREAETQGLVGVSVAVGRGTKLVHTAHFGWEDREGSIAASDATMYRWASVSKPVTAVLAMQASAAGKLDLDADVRKYVPEFPEKTWEGAAVVITARQLLTHQGGIVHYSNGPVIKTQREYDVPNPFERVVVALDWFKESPLVAKPGAKHSYTTHGYILLGAVVERAWGAEGGGTFAGQVKEKIAAPLGMTSFRPDYQWEKIEHRAVGYRRDRSADQPAETPNVPADKRREKPAPPAMVRSTDTDVSWKLPGGGFISTVADMGRFGCGMLGTKLVMPEVRAQMWTAQKTADGAATGYGLGFGVGTAEGMPMISHSGAQEKTSTFLLILPKHGKEGIVVAVMTNTEGANLRLLARDLAEIVELDEKFSAFGTGPKVTTPRGK